jgi:putative protease
LIVKKEREQRFLSLSQQLGRPMARESKMQLNSPAGSLPCLMTAVDAGADSVYIGFQSPTNLRNLPGLNFSVADAAEGVEYAHRAGVRVYVAVNTHPLDGQLEQCFRAVDHAYDIGADAVIAADWAVLDYAQSRHTNLELHLSCLAGAADPAAVRFYQEEFGVSCVVLPRVLSLEQIAVLRKTTDVLLEVIVFGVLCANYEGRCCLSSFITGTSANSVGSCAPAELVQFGQSEEGGFELRLNGVQISDCLALEQAAYPTPCKGKYYNPVIGQRVHAFQDSCGLNALPVLGQLAEAGVDIVKIEGRQRSLAYVREVTSIWRTAIDTLDQTDAFDYRHYRSMELESLQEGRTGSLGALAGGTNR